MTRGLAIEARTRQLRRRGAEEGGYVMVAALALLIIVLALGLAVVAVSLSSQQTTTHDMRVRRAQQAADAGEQTELYQQEESNVGASYNFTGGTLGLSSFLDCTVPAFDVNGYLTGLSVEASSGGICPTQSGGTGNVPWTALGDHAYAQSEFLSNKQEEGGTGTGSLVEFPEIVSIGCDTATVGKCGTSTGTAYSRELTLFQPTGPLDAIEGTGNVTLNGLSVLGINTAVAVDGNVVSGGTMTLPAVAAALNPDFTLNSSPTATSVIATLAAKSFSTTLTTAKEVTITGFCSAGTISNSCIVERPPLSISTTSCATCSTGITCTGTCTGGGYVAGNDTFTLTGGTETFAAGDYEFCNFNATGGTVKTSATSTTPVRIFILPPNQPPCSTYSYSTPEKTAGATDSVGNFTASQGMDNLTTGTVNNVSNTVDPSALQIFVQGDGSYDNDTVVNVSDPAPCKTLLLGVCTVAGSPAEASEAMVIYAPTSAVTMNEGTCLVGLLGSCTLGAAGAFSGSIAGDTVSITASAIVQDLDIGNYPLYSGVNELQPSEYVQCDNSVRQLTGSSSDTGGC